MYTFELHKYLNPCENINIQCLRDPECSLHTHEFVELIFIAEGHCTHYIDKERYDTAPGDLLFVNYGQTHAFEAASSLLYYNLLYVPEFFSKELINSESIYEIFEMSLFEEFAYGSGFTPPNRRQLVHFSGNEYLEIKKLIEDMEREFSNKETGYRSVLNGYSRVLFSRILRKFKSGSLPTESQKCINRLTAECLAYIDERCFEKISLKEIAEHTFYHPSYLSRAFKQHCGISLSEYIKEKRIKEAGRLLQTTNLGNEEIMSRVGYTDKKQFYQNFREIYHCTPAALRKNSLP